MSTQTILVWQLCCEADNHTSDIHKKDTRVRELTMCRLPSRANEHWRGALQVSHAGRQLTSQCCRELNT